MAVSRYSVEIYLSHSTEAFRRETLLCGVSEIFLQRKSLWIKAEGRGGRLKVFRPKFFSHSAEKFHRGNLCFRKFLISKRFMPERGMSPSSIENLLSCSTKKLRWGTLLCSTKFLLLKKFTNKS